jgi:hypothetical protein
MSAAAPAWKPQINRSEPPREGGFWQRPGVKATLRALSLVAGIATAACAFVVVGFYAAVLGCAGEETRGLCVHHAGLVPVLEWPIFVLAVAAPLAGGIASFMTRRPGWLGLGIAVAGVMFGLMIAVSTGQSSYLS